MKKVTHVSLGGRSFILNEDAYDRLTLYLEHFRNRLTVPESQKGEVMEDIENRIAELFYQEVKDSSRVISLEVTEKVIATLGMPDGSAEEKSSPRTSAYSGNSPKKLFRDMDQKRIAGVCSGLAHYFDQDVTLFRVIFLVALVCGAAGFWAYLILWIAVPPAMTPYEKCQMHGVPASAENMSHFTTYNK